MAGKLWFVDDEPSRRYPLYTRGNIGEVFPEVVTPLTWTVYGRQGEQGWRGAWRKFGVYLDRDFGDDPMGILGCFGGYGYLNASYIRVFAVRTPGLKVEDLDNQFFGESDAPAYVPQKGDKSLAASLRVVRTVLRTISAKSLPGLEEDKRKVAAWLGALPDLATAPDEQLLAILWGGEPMFRDLFDRHILGTFQLSAARGLLAQICEQKLHDASLTNRLVGGIGLVESAVPSFAMWDLSRLAPDSPEFEAGFAAFLDEFGCRGPNEWEGSSETWGTQPALALAAIGCMRASDDRRSPRGQQDRLARDREQATASAATNSGVQDGSVMGATRTSPGPRPRGSRGSSTTRARPRATPGQPAMPVNVEPALAVSVGASRRSHVSMGGNSPWKTNGGTSDARRSRRVLRSSRTAANEAGSLT